MSQDKSMLRKFMPGSPKKPEVKPPRTVQEINTEYTSVCGELGSKTIQAESVKRQIEHLFNKVGELNSEMNARTELDKKEKKDEPAQTNEDKV